ncbi:hypothetical protein JR316_0012702 [Psilocybe cubensis]|uniref:Uncharacterized protein n=2 Tax=Psilocybe cubensis TaxID=181762 RepID=A0ACB8GIN8_PSICU|nr:hypothetical protein JR316_0012702 [Psilocybe cubensis]KAH9475585.1 hypothetical protein JR316_0012702 [Psilocybe cubensis]
MYPRRFRFTSNNLGRDVTLALMFDSPAGGSLDQKFFPVCWKVLTFAAHGISSAAFEYEGRTGFFEAEISDRHVIPQRAASCEPGQRVIITNEHDIVVGSGVPGVIQCVNQTDAPIHIGVGLFSDGGSRHVQPIYLWRDIQVRTTVSVEFTPILSIYATRDYGEREMIKLPIELPVIYKQNILDLDSREIEYTVSFNHATGLVEISREN